MLLSGSGSGLAGIRLNHARMTDFVQEINLPGELRGIGGAKAGVLSDAGYVTNYDADVELAADEDFSPPVEELSVLVSFLVSEEAFAPLSLFAAVLSLRA